MHPAEIAVSLWLNHVVIGLNLCPFSGKPARERRIRFAVSEADAEEKLLDELRREIELLDNKTAAEIETTLIIIPHFLDDFFDYHQFLGWANQLIKRMDRQGIYQIASFHPHYCFAGTDPSDAENLTNRAPYPILHLIREDSLAKALEYYPDVEAIPDRNRAKVEALSQQEKQKLFPYLFAK